MSTAVSLFSKLAAWPRARARTAAWSQAQDQVLRAALRRVYQLEADKAELTGWLESTQADLSETLNEMVQLRRHRAALLHAVRSRSSLNLPADLRALIEEGALGE